MPATKEKTSIGERYTMARQTGPRGKLVRKFGENIFENPKFDKILARKSYGPGQHGPGRRKRISNYGFQLREKQKLKYMYGLQEKQFVRFFKKADRMTGKTGENLLILLESRLDNVVFRLGLAATRSAARQLVSHKHILVNGKSVSYPAFLLRPGDEIQIKEKSRKLIVIHDSVKRIKGDIDLPWLTLDKATLSGKFKSFPERDHLNLNIKEQLVVELYSK